MAKTSNKLENKLDIKVEKSDDNLAISETITEDIGNIIQGIEKEYT